MRKILISLLIIILAVGSAYLLVKGVSIGNLEILGIEGLKEKSEILSNNLQGVSELINRDYPKAISDLDEANKNLQAKKNDYNDLIILSTENITEKSQYGNYEVEYLWSIIGNHAKKEGVELKIEIVDNITNPSTEMYDLKFTVTGDYVSITDFISDIENDTSLGFKIEEFKIIPSGENLTATFACKEISIKIDKTLLATPENTEATDNTSNDTQGNTTSNTNTNNSATTTQNNTTNTSNQTSGGSNSTNTTAQ